MNNTINRFIKRYDDDNDSLPLIQVNFNNRPKTFQKHLKKVSPDFHKILTGTGKIMEGGCKMNSNANCESSNNEVELKQLFFVEQEVKDLL